MKTVIFCDTSRTIAPLYGPLGVYSHLRRLAWDVVCRLKLNWLTFRVSVSLTGDNLIKYGDYVETYTLYVDYLKEYGDCLKNTL